MQTLGLIGYPLSHSFSKAYFTEKFEKENIDEHEYQLFPLATISEVKALLTKENLKGLNVTIPYKQQVIPFLDELDEEAAKVGAVNTIKIVDGKTKGFNTDIYGFEYSLQPLLKSHHKKALILGTGGAAKAVAYVLEKLNIAYIFVSRKPTEKQLAYSDIDEVILKEHTILINTTPLGMYPKIDACPTLPYQQLTDQHILYDLVYNPAETLFMTKGKAQKAVVKNGLDMLHLQAEKAWGIWNQ